MSKDPLKDLFNETFANEPIAFEPNAWDQMDGLLQRERRKKAFWIWLGGGSSLAIITIACLSLISASAKVYEPRQSEAYAQEENIKPSNQASQTTVSVEDQEIKRPVENAVIDAVEDEKSSERTSEPAKSATTDDSSEEIVEQAESETTSEIIVADKSSSTTIPTESDKVEKAPVVTSNQTDDQEDDWSGIAIEQTKTAPEPSAIAPPVNDQPKVDINRKQRETKALALMPPLDRVTEQNAELESRTDSGLEAPLVKKFPEPYIRIGLSNAQSNTARNGIGQIGGIGLSYQIADKLLVSGEALLARDHTDYFYTDVEVNYGFDVYQSVLRIYTLEMMHAEVPFMLHYRENRFRVGTGISAGILISSLVAEGVNDPSAPNQQFSSASEAVLEVEEKGYVNWRSLRQLQISIPIDAQYQLNERYFVGTRLQLGLTDAFVPTPNIDRLHRAELYLKMNIIR